VPNVLADGLKDVAYQDATLTVTNGPTGGNVHFYWELAGGQLPPGMYISTYDSDADVTIFGKPTAIGQYNFTVAVRDWSVTYPNNPTYCQVGDSEDYQITVHSGGHITVALATLPATGVDVPFTSDFGSFTLDNDPAGQPPGKRTFIVPAGEYDVLESDPAAWGYQLTAISCTEAQLYDLPNRRLALTVQDGDSFTCTFTNAFRRVDLEIAKVPAGPYKGGNVYAGSATSAQTLSRTGVPQGTYHYTLRIGNDGPKVDRFKVRGASSGSSRFAVRFFYHGIDVTTAVGLGTWQTSGVQPGSAVMLDVRVVEKPGASPGASNTVVVRAVSAGRPDQVDVVRAITTR
jgi:hypothetical protein